MREKNIVTHVLALCETYLNENNCSLAEIENYKSVHTVRKQRTGEGTSLYVHDTVKLIKKLDTPFCESFESVMIEAKFKGKFFSIMEIYRPPNSSDDVFREHLFTVLKLGLSHDITFICGDFNYDLLKVHLHKPT